MPRNKRKTLKNKLNKLWSDLIKVRADNKCEVCGNKLGLNSHHINGKKSDALRFDLSNGICLCMGHHTFGQISAHSTSYEGQKRFHELLESIIPKRLEKAGNIPPRKIHNIELEEMIEEYKIKLKQLNQK